MGFVKQGGRLSDGVGDSERQRGKEERGSKAKQHGGLVRKVTTQGRMKGAFPLPERMDLGHDPDANLLPRDP